jgi:hypothetical protein
MSSARQQLRGIGAEARNRAAQELGRKRWHGIGAALCWLSKTDARQISKQEAFGAMPMEQRL